MKEEKYYCDWCGKEIDKSDMIKIDITSCFGYTHLISGISHYHSECWDEIGKGKPQPEKIYLCPICGESNGSLSYTVEENDIGYTSEFTCHKCGRTVINKHPWPQV